MDTAMEWSLWNLLVVVCFALLYWAVAMVFLQLRRLRDELKVQHTPSRFPDMDEDEEEAAPPTPAPSPMDPRLLHALVQDGVQKAMQQAMEDFPVPGGSAPPAEGVSREALREVVRREMSALEKKMDELNATVGADLQREMDALKRELRYLERAVHALNAPPAEVNRSLGEPPASPKDEAYREARLLLANGVDEERVIEETGLSVEEVSLLKRLSQDGRPLP